MFDFSPGQGSALSGFFTATGAIGAIVLAQHFFKSRITNLQGAIEKTELVVQQFQASMAEKLAAIDRDVGSLNQALSGVQTAVSQTQAAIHENSQIDDEEAPVAQQGNASFKEKLSQTWHELIEHIEQVASSPNIDGRTRAKYARIDRRSYYDLFGSLSDDGRLNGLQPQADEAAQLWYANRRRNVVPSEDVDRMTQLRDQLLQIQIL